MLPRRRWIVWTCLGLVAGLSAIDHAGVFGYQAADRERYSGVEARVTNALAFDTLEVDIVDGGRPSTRVRLHGIVPLPTSEDRSQGEQFAEEALDFVKQNAVGKRVTLALDPARRTRNREGRLLAYVYLAESGELLNQTLIERGLSSPDHRTEHILKFQFTDRAKRATKSRISAPKRNAHEPRNEPQTDTDADDGE